ncbi:MAG TPA: TetR/AcrR family transcriptional regulator [Roseiflexaceae bacterium]|nr:TetR/AcrR family transcriptional regulator [Roseiflexaceae bacterium]
MGSKDRRARIKQTTRQGILAGARQIAQEEGWSALTIRKVAEHIEYSPSIVYEYFDSKEDILRALLQEGFQMLTTAMAQAQASTADPTERVLRLGDAYWQFAHANPDLYQVMHGLAGVTVSGEARAQAVQEVCRITEQSLIDWADAQGMRLADPYAATEVIWALLHGLISLRLADRLTGDEEHTRRQLRDAGQALLRGWALPTPGA